MPVEAAKQLVAAIKGIKAELGSSHLARGLSTTINSGKNRAMVVLGYPRMGRRQLSKPLAPGKKQQDVSDGTLLNKASAFADAAKSLTDEIIKGRQSWQDGLAKRVADSRGSSLRNGTISVNFETGDIPTDPEFARKFKSWIGRNKVVTRVTFSLERKQKPAGKRSSSITRSPQTFRK